MRHGTLNKYKQPLGSPIDNTTNPSQVPWQFGVKQGVQARQIRASNVNFKNLQPIQNNGSMLGTHTLGSQLNLVGTNANKGMINNLGGTTIGDPVGLVSLNNFESGGTVGSGTNQLFTTNSYVDVNNMTLTTSNFSRSRQVFIIYTALMSMDSTDGTSNYNGNGIVIFNIDGSEPQFDAASQWETVRTNSYYTGYYRVVTIHHYMTLGTGTHTIKMQAQVQTISGTPQLKIHNAGTNTNFQNQRLTYFVLGV